MIKVLADADYMLQSNTTTHMTVFSSKRLSEAKALDAAKKYLRARGFIVTDLVFDPSTERSAQVSAHIR